MTDALHLTPREGAQVEAALDADGASPPQSRLERDLSDFHVDRVSECPSPEIVALAAAITTRTALRSVSKEDEDDEQ